MLLNLVDTERMHSHWLPLRLRRHGYVTMFGSTMRNQFLARCLHKQNMACDWLLVTVHVASVLRPQTTAGNRCH